MLSDVVRVALERLEIEGAVVVEAQRLAVFALGATVQHPVNELAVLVLVFLILVKDCFLSRPQHAVKPAQYRHRQHDPLVLRRPIGATQ